MENEERTYYTHDFGCRPEFHPPNERGLKQCIDCAGIFDADGKGVAVTDTRFDENWEERRAAGAGWNDGGPAQ
jgi:hypothetical protein